MLQRKRKSVERTETDSFYGFRFDSFIIFLCSPLLTSTVDEQDRHTEFTASYYAKNYPQFEAEPDEKYKKRGKAVE